MSKEHTKQNYLSGQFKMDVEDITLINNKFNRKLLRLIHPILKVLNYDESDNAHKIYTSRGSKRK